MIATSPDMDTTGTSVKKLIGEYASTQVKQLNRPSYDMAHNKNSDTNKAQSTDITLTTCILIVLFTVVGYISIHSYQLLPQHDTDYIKSITVRSSIVLICIYILYVVMIQLKQYPIIRIQVLVGMGGVVLYYEQLLTQLLARPLHSKLLITFLCTVIIMCVYLIWYRKALSSLRTNDNNKQILLPVNKKLLNTTNKHDVADVDSECDSDVDNVLHDVTHDTLWTSVQSSDGELLDSEVSRGKQLKRLLQQLAHKRIDEFSKRFGSFNKLSELAKKHINITPEKKPRPHSINTIYDDIIDNTQAIDSLYDEPHYTGGVADSATLHDELYFLSSKYISMSRSNFDALHEHLEWVVLQSNKLIYTKGDCSDSGMYIIMDGSVSVLDDYGKVLCVYTQGDSFGEIELITNWQRSRTIKTIQPTTLMRITRHVFNQFTSERPDIYISFLKTSLSRQWRIATFILDEFLHISVRDYNAEQLLYEQQQSQNTTSLFMNSNESPPVTPISPNLNNRQQSYRSDTVQRPPAYLNHTYNNNNSSFTQLPDPDTLHRYDSHKLHTFISDDKDKLNLLCTQTETIELSAGQVLYEEGSHIHDLLYIVLDGRVVATRDISDTIASLTNTDDVDTDDTSEIYDIGVGGLIGAVPYITGCKHPYTCRTMTKCKFAVFTQSQLNAAPPLSILVDMTRLVAQIVAPTLLQFSSLGLKREWRRAGDTLFVSGSKPSDVYIVVHGRVRIIVNQNNTMTNKLKSAAHSHNKSNISNTTDYTTHSTYNNTNTMFTGRTSDRDTMRIEVGRGESVGELALLQNNDSNKYSPYNNTNTTRQSRHSSTAVCVRDSEVVRISAPAFEHMKRLYPQVNSKFSSILANRLHELLTQDTNQVPKSPFTGRSNSCLVITLFPHNSTVNINSFAAQLSLSLQLHGPTLHIDTSTIDRILGGETSKHLDEYHQRLRLTSYINDMETQHRFLLLQAKPNITEWTQCCCRVADCILIIADINNTPTVPNFEQKLLWKQHHNKIISNNTINQSDNDTVNSTSPHTDSNTNKYKRTFQGVPNRKQQRQHQHVNFCIKDLVLLHPPDTILPSGTRRWFANRRLHSYHHIRIDVQEHYDRLARYLSGRTVGVVLSGGGARGLAHLGVINALCDQNISIDMISGTSQGSFMAALYALQSQHDRQHIDSEMAVRTKSMADKLGSIWELLRDATLPTMSYFDGYNFSATIRDLLGANVQIEDLWIKYLCVTTNVSTADMCVHRQGVLWKAVRASMTILDYLPPMQISAQSPDLLIDGGYTNNLPVDVMRYYYQPTKCIAVDVENKDDERLSDVLYYGSSLNGWWLFIRKIYSAVVPFTQQLKIPKYTELVSSLVFINHNRTIRYLLDSNLIDLYIRPELGSTQLLDYHKLNDIVDIGYKYGKLKITEFRINYHHELSFVRTNNKSADKLMSDTMKRRSNARSNNSRYKYHTSGDYSNITPPLVSRSVSSINVQSLQSDNDVVVESNITNINSADDVDTIDSNESLYTAQPLPIPVELHRSSTLPPHNSTSPTNEFSSSI